MSEASNVGPGEVDALAILRDELAATAASVRQVGDSHPATVLHALMELPDRSIGIIAGVLHQPVAEVESRILGLTALGLVESRGEGANTTYAITGDAVVD